MSSIGVLVLGACGSSDEGTADTDATDPNTQIRVRYENPDVGIDADYTITCDPTATLSGDDVTLDAEAACDATDDPAVVSRLVDPPGDRVCTEIYGGADTAELRGTIDGTAVETSVDRTNGCGIDDWDQVLDALLPPAVGPSDVTSSSSPPTTPPASATSPPTTTVTSTTAPPPTSTSVPASTTIGTTTVAPTTPDGLTGWPEPPTPPSLADVPYLLPGGPIDGVVDGLREETRRAPDDSGDAVEDHIQFWLSRDGSSQLTIRTHLRGEPVGSEDFRVPVDVPGWQQAFTFDVTGPYSGVTLVDEDGYVAVESYGIDRDDVVGLARSLSRRQGGEPGWDIDAGAADLVAVHEGWSFGAIGTVAREIDWFDASRQLEAELSISIGQPGRFGQVWRPDEETTFAEVGGTQAMVVHYDYDTDAPTIVVWSPAPDQVVQFGVIAEPERALEIARAIGPVSASAWNSVARPPDTPRDGCTTFVC